MLKNNLTTPSQTEMRRLGHDLNSLYESTRKISCSRGGALKETKDIDPITVEIIQLLNEFAKGSRYHNLDGLASGKLGLDPLEAWGLILDKIITADLPTTTVNRLKAKLHALTDPLEDVSFILTTGLDGSLLSLRQAFVFPALHEKAAKRAVLRIVMFLSSIKDLISKQCFDVYYLDDPSPPIPQMQEFLEWVWDDRNYVLRKKRWP